MSSASSRLSRYAQALCININEYLQFVYSSLNVYILQVNIDWIKKSLKRYS